MSDINLSIEIPAICPEEVTSASVVLTTALRIALTTPVGLYRNVNDYYYTFQKNILPEYRKTS